MTSSLRIGTSIIAAMSLAIVAGCGGERLSPAATVARKELQFARPQEALDKLSEPPADTTSEGHYLRACALEQLDRMDAANAEIQQALDASPKNPKYRGYSLRLKLFKGDSSVVDPLLQLHDENPSSAAVSLYAVFAFQAKHVKQRSEGKLRAARVQLDKARTSLQTALSLAAEIPESHRELIGMSIWFEQHSDALKLVDALLREEPDRIEFLRDRVKILLLAKQPAETISAASTLYKRQDRTEAAAVEFANVLQRLPPSPAVLDQLNLIRGHFPANTAILLRYCWTLGKAGRAEEACAEIAKAFDQQTDPRRRQTLAQSAIAIPLEAENADIASEQLKKFRKAIGDAQMIAFFEGQLASLKKDYAKSVEKMQDVFNLYRTDSTASPELARAALGRIRRVLSEQQLAEQVRKAAELTLRRSGLNRYDEDIVREEAQSLLNLLEANERLPSERPKSEGPTVRLPDVTPSESEQK